MLVQTPSTNTKTSHSTVTTIAFDRQMIINNDKNNNNSKPQISDSANGSFSDELILSPEELQIIKETSNMPSAKSRTAKVNENHNHVVILRDSPTKLVELTQIQTESSEKDDDTGERVSELQSKMSNKKMKPDLPQETQTIIEHKVESENTPNDFDNSTKKTTVPVHLSIKDSTHSSIQQVQTENSTLVKTPVQSVKVQTWSDPSPQPYPSSTSPRSSSTTASSFSFPIKAEYTNTLPNGKPRTPSSEASVSIQAVPATGVKKSSSSRNLAESAGQLFARGISRSQSSSLLNKTISTISNNLTSIASKSASKSLIGRSIKNRNGANGNSTEKNAIKHSATCPSIAEMVLVTNEEEDELSACDHEPGLEFDDSELEPSKIDKGKFFIS